MTEPTPAGQVPLALYSAALDEVHVLRRAAAYEAMANEATAEMTVPVGVRTLLSAVNETYLYPAARGLARTVPVQKKITVHRTGYEATRSLRGRTETSPDHLVDEARYLTALAEIAALRTVLAAVATRMPDLLLFKTLPTSRRPIIGQQIVRLAAAAHGRGTSHYAGKPPRLLDAAMAEAGATTLRLTRAAFEAEHATDQEPAR